MTYVNLGVRVVKRISHTKRREEQNKGPEQQQQKLKKHKNTVGVPFVEYKL